MISSLCIGRCFSSHCSTGLSSLAAGAGFSMHSIFMDRIGRMFEALLVDVGHSVVGNGIIPMPLYRTNGSRQ